MEIVAYLCIGYIVVGVVLAGIGLIIDPLCQYEGENQFLFHLANLVEDTFGQFLAGYLLSLPIIMVVICWLTGWSLGELT